MRKWTFLWVPRGGGKVREFRVPRLLIVLALVLGAVGYASLYYSLQHIRELEARTYEIKNVLDENQSLGQQLSHLNQKMDRLKEKIAGLAQQELVLEELSDLPRGKRRLRDRGDGAGAPLSVENFPGIRDSLQSLASLYEEVIRKISADSAALEFVPTLRPTVPGAAITARFGFQSDPFSDKVKLHRGIDFAFDAGTPVFAAATGVVSFSGKEKGFGNVIRLTHGGEWETLYGHLDAIAVYAGQKVKKGQRIGTMGSTGRSIGPHLHYEVTRGGRYFDPELLF